MAETYSTEYASFLAVGGKSFIYGNGLYRYPVHYTQLELGAADDTIVLARFGPKTLVDMSQSFFVFTGWGAGLLLSVGWRTYKDLDGVVQDEEPAGLLDELPLEDDGAWNGGVLIIAADATGSAPVVWEKDFNNMTEVVIFATLTGDDPPADSVLNGAFVCHMT